MPQIYLVLFSHNQGKCECARKSVLYYQTEYPKFIKVHMYIQYI